MKKDKYENKYRRYRPGSYPDRRLPRRCEYCPYRPYCPYAAQFNSGSPRPYGPGYGRPRRPGPYCPYR